MGNRGYYSLEKILSSRLLSKKLKVKTYKTITLPVVLYGCETWSFTLREEHKLRVLSEAHSPTLPSFQLRHNPSVALPTLQLILQPFCCFTYLTAHSPTLLSLLLRHKLFTYVTWRAAHTPHYAVLEQ